jgi:hypothetical protein
MEAILKTIFNKNVWIKSKDLTWIKRNPIFYFYLKTSRLVVIYLFRNEFFNQQEATYSIRQILQPWKAADYLSDGWIIFLDPGSSILSRDVQQL